MLKNDFKKDYRLFANIHRHWKTKLYVDKCLLLYAGQLLYADKNAFSFCRHCKCLQAIVFVFANKSMWVWNKLKSIQSNLLYHRFTFTGEFSRDQKSEAAHFLAQSQNIPLLKHQSPLLKQMIAIFF